MDVKFLFFDTETNGLPRDYKAPITDSANWPRLVQLAWLLCDPAGEMLAEQSIIIKPEGFTIDEASARIHRITQARALAVGQPLVEALDAFEADLVRASDVVAHNLSFDKKIIAAERHRLGRTPLIGQAAHCTMLMGTPVCRLPGNYGFKWPTLTELHRFLFSEGIPDAHDALVDVKACARAFFEMRRRQDQPAVI
ncbi:MAG: 3'-5' exonuclease [Elusimicrobia bacterium]|nr:3'-5' exonuclease [Elusimicrobiota bacterium]